MTQSACARKETVAPVSYTHLDVYKRQCLTWPSELVPLLWLPTSLYGAGHTATGRLSCSHCNFSRVAHATPVCNPDAHETWGPCCNSPRIPRHQPECKLKSCGNLPESVGNSKTGIRDQGSGIKIPGAFGASAAAGCPGRSSH